MNRPLRLAVLAIGAPLLFGCATGTGSNPMTFFVTSVGPGKGGDGQNGGMTSVAGPGIDLSAAGGAGGNGGWKAYCTTDANGTVIGIVHGMGGTGGIGNTSGTNGTGGGLFADGWHTGNGGTGNAGGGNGGGYNLPDATAGSAGSVRINWIGFAD